MAAMMPRSRAHAGPLRSEADRIGMPSSRRTISTNKAGLVYTRLFRFSGKKVVWCAACFILGVFLPTLFPRYFGGSKAPAALRRVVRTDTFTDDTPCGRLGMMQVIQMPQQRVDHPILKDRIPTITMNATEYASALTHDSDPINLLEMPRVRWREGMSLYDLYEKHRGRAFIVEGALDDQPFIADGKTIASLGKMCEGGKLQSFLVPDGSRNSVANASMEGFAGHNDARTIETGEFVRDYVLDDGIKSAEGRYAHPMIGAHIWCPSLMDDIRFPAFLGERWCGHSDTLRTRGVLSFGQPEVFLGPKGTRSKMHMDNHLTPFWMLLYDGVKRFRVIHSDQYLGPHLRPLFEPMALSKDTGYTKSVSAIHRVQPDDGTPAVFCSEKNNHKFDPFKPNLSLFPEFTNVEIYEGTLRRGDAIYLPSATLHGVVNDEASFGISSNEILPQDFEHALDACLLFPHKKIFSTKGLGLGLPYQRPDFGCTEVMGSYLKDVMYGGEPAPFSDTWSYFDNFIKNRLKEEEQKNRGMPEGKAEAKLLCKDAYVKLRNLAYSENFDEEGGMTRYKELKADFMLCLREQVPCVKKNGWKFERGSTYKFQDISFLKLFGFNGIEQFCSKMHYDAEGKSLPGLSMLQYFLEEQDHILSDEQNDAVVALCNDECKAVADHTKFLICRAKCKKERLRILKESIVKDILDGVVSQCEALLP